MAPAAARLSILCGLLLAGACSEWPGPLESGPGGSAPETETPSIRTDRTAYRVSTSAHSHEVTIGVAYTNPTDGTVYLPTCLGPHPPVLEKWEEGEWVTAFSPVVPRCLGPPVEVGPGERYAYDFRISASRRANEYPRFEVAEIPGTYRLRWRFLRTWTPDGPEPGMGEPLPEELGLSNTFRLTR